MALANSPFHQQSAADCPASCKANPALPAPPELDHTASHSRGRSRWFGCCLFADADFLGCLYPLCSLAFSVRVGRRAGRHASAFVPSLPRGLRQHLVPLELQELPRNRAAVDGPIRMGSRDGLCA